LKTFDQTIRSFITTRKNSIDVIREKYLRPEIRTFLNDSTDESTCARLKAALTKSPKQVPINNLPEPIESPYKLLNYTTKTSIQTTALKHISTLQFAGNYAYSGSCGSGKTLAGISFIHGLQCKTLIISSRNSINDQWRNLLATLYPNLVIETRVGKFIGGVKVKPSNASHYDTDIWVFSPQCLLKRMDFPMTPSLILYDEVHSLMSDEFIQVLLLPFNRCMKKTWAELPYMVAFSATFPCGDLPKDKNALNRIMKIFGKIYYEPSAITNIPVHVWDYRNSYGDLGKYDSKYIPFVSDQECVQYFCDKVNLNERIQVCNEYKGLIMTYTIDSSVFAALFAHQKWKCGVVLIRALDQKSLYFPSDEEYEWDYETHGDITYDELIEAEIGIPCEYQDVVKDCAVVVGTFHRLKEGFSVQNLVWGICTKFVWSVSSRIQILGRIRRSSQDKALNEHYRIFYVCSVKVPTNLMSPYRMKTKGPIKVLYDFDIEEELFKEENYTYIDDTEGKTTIERVDEGCYYDSDDGACDSDDGKINERDMN
jgi:hypothetical protein